MFLITALSLTGFFAHYVGITVYSMLAEPDPNQVGLSLYLVLTYHSVSGIVYLGWSSISSTRTPSTGTVLKEK